jgi:sn-glycerol 3-phosphate transport system permease protein
MVQLMYLSFFDYNLVNPVKQFVGIDNYTTLLFVKTDFLICLQNTVVYTAAVVVLLIALSLLFALWFQADNRLNRFAQAAAFTPHLIAMVSCAMIWSWIMDQNSYGILNVVLSFFKLPPLRWLNSSNTAMLSVVIVSVWKSIGYYALIILSALKAIPTEIYEAAALDNTPKVRTFLRLPCLYCRRNCFSC